MEFTFYNMSGHTHSNTSDRQTVKYISYLFAWHMKKYNSFIVFFPQLVFASAQSLLCEMRSVVISHKSHKYLWQMKAALFRIKGFRWCSVVPFGRKCSEKKNKATLVHIYELLILNHSIMNYCIICLQSIFCFIGLMSVIYACISCH